ncbi:Ribosomal L32p protein family [Rhizoctonia solani]|uniref:Ribosomal L32p protein family n=1 Tax=Rhizoctonia solani TaxID=456999 RepID=A0A8H7LHR0_9AGAM|nr:Ribosomal L32p protein family [Rhizoctonia solani]
MASLALPLARTSARIAWSSRLFGLGITTGPAPSGPTLRLAERLSALPSLRTLLELFPPIVLAVPKKKTSPSKKRMRSANKGLKDKTSACPQVLA